MNYTIVAVHGTFASSPSIRGDLWWQKGSPFSEAVLSYIGGENDRVFWEPFTWSGDNSLLERDKAGRKLAARMTEKPFQPDRKIYLCHSHGGNVFQRAAQIAEKTHDRPKAITMGTPYLAESALQGFSMLANLSRMAAVLGIAILVLLKLMDFATVVEQGMLVLLCICLAVLGIFGVFRTFARQQTTSMFRASLPADANVLTRFLHRYWRFMQSGAATALNEKTVADNFRDIKIYSMFDEAILGLRKAHKQSIHLANRANSIWPAAGISAIILCIVITLALDALGTDILSHAWMTEREILRDIFPALPTELRETLNLTGNVLLFLGACAIGGLLLAYVFAARLAANVLNSSLTQIAQHRALGRDGVFSISVPDRVSANLAMLYGQLGPEHKWRAMPKDFDTTLNKLLDEGTVETAQAIRETLAMGMLAGEYSMFESVARNFTGEELVHTSYYRHPDFAAFTAWLLVHKCGLPPSRKFENLTNTEQFEDWYDAIRPQALDS